MPGGADGVVSGCGGVGAADVTRVVESTGKAPAEELILLGEDRLTARYIAGAVAAFDQAEGVDTEPVGAEQTRLVADRCAAGRWMCWMLLGEFERAWRESDAIRERGLGDVHRFWDGAAIDGKRVMVRSLHGFGDAVQNLRYLPMLRERASEVVVEVAPEIVGLVRCFAGAGEVVTWGSGAPRREPEWDMQVEVTELPYMFRSTVEDVPVRVPYVQVPDGLRAEAARRLAARGLPRVGLVWASSQWDTTRSVPFPLLRGLLACEGVEFWSLQTAVDNGPWRAWSAARGWPVRVGGEGAAEETAAMMEGMDLVISVDTFAAHLAGALGKPVWTLLQKTADWRWMIGRDDSPWYPTMRLFRGRQDGGWEELVGRVGSALRERFGIRERSR